MYELTRGLCLGAGLCLLAGSVLAAEDSRDTGSIETLLQLREETVEVSQESRKRDDLLEGYRPVRFEEILDDPDNVELNFLYAQQQIAAGNLMGAAGTLERILMIDPGLPRVRLLYAIVLIRLDNLKEAQRELESMLGMDMPSSLRTDLDRYLRLIRSRRKSTRFIIQQTTGFQYDDNRNSAPSSKRQLVSEIPVATSGTSRQRGDTSFLNVTSLEVRRDLGYQAGHEVFGKFTYFLQEQTVVDNLDLQSFRGDAGAVIYTAPVEIRPRFYASHIFLSRETFLRTQGAGLSAARSWNERWRSEIEFHLERQDYGNISDSTTASARKGPESGVTWINHFMLRPDMRLSAEIGFRSKNAKEAIHAYETLDLGLRHTWILPGGMFLLQSLAAEFDFYDEVDITVAGRHRRDRTLRYRVTYGLPLEALPGGGSLPALIRDIVLTATYEYSRTLSTITNYTYDNNRYQMLISKTVEF